MNKKELFLKTFQRFENISSQHFFFLRLNIFLIYTILLLFIVLSTGVILDINYESSFLLCFIGFLLFSGGYILLGPFHKCSKKKLAWKIEAKIPNFNEKLITAVDLSTKQSLNYFEEQVFDEAIKILNRNNPNDLFCGNRKIFKIMLCSAFCFLGLFFSRSSGFRSQAVKIIMPMFRTENPSHFFILKPNKSTYHAGDIDFEIEFLKSAETAKILIYSKKKSFLKKLNLKKTQQKKTLSTIYKNVKQTFFYQLKTNSFISQYRKIKIIKKPKIKMFEFTITPPKYTGLLTKKIKSHSGNLRVLKGSKIHINITTNQKLSTMNLQRSGSTFSLNLDSTKTRGTHEFQFHQDMDYSLYFVNKNFVAGEENLHWKITAISDEKPQIHILYENLFKQAGSKDQLDISWEASDDFGIFSQTLFIWINGERKSSLILDVNARKYRFDLKTFNLKTGDQFSYQIQVKDKANNHALTSKNDFLILAETSLARKQMLLSLSLELIKLTNTLKKQLNKISYYVEEFEKNTSPSVKIINSELNQYDQNLIKFQNILEHFNSFSNKKYTDSLTQNMLKRLLKIRLDILFELKNSAQAHTVISRLFQQTQTLSRTTKTVYDLTKLNLNLEVSDRILKSIQGKISHQNYLKNFKKIALSIIEKKNHVLMKSLKEFSFTKPAKMQKGFKANFYRNHDYYLNEKEQQNKIPTISRIDKVINYSKFEHFRLKERTYFTARWTGFLRITRPDEYTFYTVSDDGSLLFIDNQPVVDNDGIHSAIEKSGKIYLTKGFHTIEIMYYDKGGDCSMQVFWKSSAEFAKQLISDSNILQLSATQANLASILQMIFSRLTKDYQNINTDIKPVHFSLKNFLLKTSKKLTRNTKQSNILQILRIAEIFAESAKQTQNAKLAEKKIHFAQNLRNAVSQKQFYKLKYLAKIVNNIPNSQIQSPANYKEIFSHYLYYQYFAEEKPKPIDYTTVLRGYTSLPAEFEEIDYSHSKQFPQKEQIEMNKLYKRANKLYFQRLNKQTKK